MFPCTRYVKSGDVNIAYQVVGDGSVDLLWIPGFGQHLELSWEEPYRRAWLEALATEYRLIVFDKRGTGLSDRVDGGAAAVEVRMDDCRAVLDGVGSQKAAIFTAGDSSDLALVFAATHPERVLAVVTWERSSFAARGRPIIHGLLRGRRRCAVSTKWSGAGRSRWRR